MKAVHLHIGRIVVEGLPKAQQRQFARVLEERLHAWAASGAASQLSSSAHTEIPSLDAGLLRPGATASQAAMQVVNSIARSVERRRTGRQSACIGERSQRGGARSCLTSRHCW